MSKVVFPETAKQKTLGFHIFKPPALQNERLAPKASIRRSAKPSRKEQSSFVTSLLESAHGQIQSLLLRLTRGVMGIASRLVSCPRSCCDLALLFGCYRNLDVGASFE